MKTTLRILATFALIIGAFHLTACENIFTQANAKQLGAQLAKSSLEVATRMILGEKVDLRKEIALIGLQTSSNAIALVTYNLNAPASATPQAVVSNAEDVSHVLISQAAVEDPAIAAKAKEIATQSALIAQGRLAQSGAVAGH